LLNRKRHSTWVLQRSGPPTAGAHAALGVLANGAIRFTTCETVPSIREATGEITTDSGAWKGLTVPKGTPVDIVNRLQGGQHTVLANAVLREYLMGQRSVMLGGMQEQYLETTSRPKANGGPTCCPKQA